jgi:hypothetical protein
MIKGVVFLICILAFTVSCSSDSGADKGRFVVEQESPSATPAPPLVQQTTPEQTPAPVTAVPEGSPAVSAKAAMEELMKQSRPDGSVARGKLYLQMTEEEKYDFIEERARHVSRIISNGTYEFSRPSIGYIKQYVDAYARRVGNGSRATWGEDLNIVFARAQTYAPTITRSFNRRRIPASIGLYLVAIETEYTNFKGENEAGAAGLFQFIAPTAESYGVPRDQRTNVDKMSDAAAHYIADRISEFGTDPMSVALCIAGYNRSPDSVRSDLQIVMNSANKERSFWTLVLNSGKLDKWFQGENIKYVPKFFAAAIVGETPWAFGLNMKAALSTCPSPSESAEARLAVKP